MASHEKARNRFVTHFNAFTSISIISNPVPWHVSADFLGFFFRRWNDQSHSLGCGLCASAGDLQSTQKPQPDRPMKLPASRNACFRSFKSAFCGLELPMVSLTESATPSTSPTTAALPHKERPRARRARLISVEGSSDAATASRASPPLPRAARRARWGLADSTRADSTRAALLRACSRAPRSASIRSSRTRRAGPSGAGRRPRTARGSSRGAS